MNCFDWNNRASDYLDGTLMGALKAEADQHLDSCRECMERFKHYRIILNSISAQPRASLPIPIRKSPLVSGLPRLGFRITRSRWDHIPWYLRTTIEGVGIVFMILLGISTGPKLRSLYERSMETNLEEFTQSFREWRESRLTSDEETPLTRGKSANVGPASVTEGVSQDPQRTEELATGDSDSEGDSAADDDDDDDATVVEGGGGNNDTSDIHVGSNEIWRFMLKTDSPHEMRPKIVKILTALQIPATTRGIGGIEAPGGIQFDLLVSPEIISDIKHELQAIAPKPPAELEKSPAGQTFTWYKNKSKTKLPDHKTRVVIWLSQM